MKNEMKKESGKRMEKEVEKEMMREMNGLKGLRQLFKEEDGMGTVEIILIIVVLVGLVIVFKEQITQVVNNIFNKITAQTNKV